MFYFIRWCFFTCVLFLSKESFCQLGCTDLNAINFNASATINNGSCVYDTTFLNVQLIDYIDTLLPELSGLVLHKNKLLAHNDSGWGNEIFTLDSSNGKVVHICKIQNSNNVDWEEITDNDSLLFIGDFGNNFGNRQDLKVYLLSKDSLVKTNALAQQLKFSFQDQTIFTSNLKTNYDCEAFIFDQDSLIFFTKNWGNSKTKMYKRSLYPNDTIAYLMDSFNTNGQITAASYDRKNKQIALLGYDTTGNSFVWLLWDFKGTQYFSGHKRRFELGLVPLQNEAVAFKDSNNLFIGSERVSIFYQRLFALDFSAIRSFPLNIEPKKLDQNIQFGRVGGDILIYSTSSIAKIQVLNRSGQVIQNFDCFEREYRFTVKKEVFIIRVLLDNGAVVSKKLVW
jgi:hypothetical protein